jgi:hypothetical protein
MPVHFFIPPARADELGPSLVEFVSSIEATGQEVVGTQPYGMLTAIFTRTTTPPAVQLPPAKPPRGPRLPNPGRVNEKAAK